MGFFAIIQCYADDKTMCYSFFSGKYWAMFVPYEKHDASLNKKEYIAVVLYFQKDTLSIISASGTYKTKYSIDNEKIKYHERNGRHLINRNLFYDKKQNILYHKKPGRWYFIPQRIIYHPLQADVAQNVIEEFQKREYHKIQLEN